jgi:hypothetical protein
MKDTNAIRFLLEAIIKGATATEENKGKAFHYYVEDWVHPCGIEYYYCRTSSGAISRMVQLIEDELDMEASNPGYDLHRLTIIASGKSQKAIEGEQLVSFWEDKKLHDNDGLFKICF